MLTNGGEHDSIIAPPRHRACNGASLPRTGATAAAAPLLLPADMMDWLPEGDIVHLIVDAVAMMDLSTFEADYKLGRAGQAPFAPQVLLALLVYAYSHGIRSSRAIERLCVMSRTCERYSWRC